MTVSTKADISGTIRARAGLVVSNALVYVTGGAAWADVEQTGTEFCGHSTLNCFKAYRAARSRSRVSTSWPCRGGLPKAVKTCLIRLEKSASTGFAARPAAPRENTT